MIYNLRGSAAFLNQQYVDGQDLGNGFYACFQGMTTARWITFGVCTILIGLCLFLLLINSGVETALTKINRLRLQTVLERHERRVVVIEQLLDRSNQVLAALSTFDTIYFILAPALTIAAMHQFNLYGIEVSAAVLLLVFFIVVFVRSVPKGFAGQNPEVIAVRFGGLVTFETSLIGPVVRLVNSGTNSILRILKRPPLPPPSLYTEQDLNLYASGAAENPDVTQVDEREMIRSIFEFGDTIVREVMVPRLDIKGVPTSSSLEDTLDIIMKSGHSRLPAFEEDVDHIQGVLYAKDLLRYLRNSGEHGSFELQKLLRPVHYVPESKKVDQLFAELQKKRVHIAIVIDEYGGTAGLVTIEDLLEEIVGEIQDEYDLETNAFERINENEVLVDARLNLDDVNNFFNTVWEAENVETVGGFVLDKLERIPEVGDRLVVTQNGEVMEEKEDLKETSSFLTYCISVLSVEGQRLGQLRLERKLPIVQEMKKKPETSDNESEYKENNYNQNETQASSSITNMGAVPVGLVSQNRKDEKAASPKPD